MHVYVADRSTAQGGQKSRQMFVAVHSHLTNATVEVHNYHTYNSPSGNDIPPTLSDAASHTMWKPQHH